MGHIRKKKLGSRIGGGGIIGWDNEAESRKKEIRGVEGTAIDEETERFLGWERVPKK